MSQLSIPSNQPLMIRSDDCGQYDLATSEQILAAAQQVIEQRFQRGIECSAPEAVGQFLSIKFAALEHEIFVALWLDSRHRLLQYSELFRGTINGAEVHPREVVKDALRHNAAAVIFAHNHPSGVAEPSAADRAVTLRLKQALELIDVRLLDHFITGGTAVTSMAARGLV